MAKYTETPWTLADDANATLINHKYSDREALGDDWVEKTKAAAAGEFLETGKPNPHYPRLRLEAEMARVVFDMAYLVEQNRRMRAELDMVCDLFPRFSVIESSISGLRLMVECAKDKYEASNEKSIKERIETATVKGMMLCGLDPTLDSDRDKFYKRISSITKGEQP